MGITEERVETMSRTRWLVALVAAAAVVGLTIWWLVTSDDDGEPTLVTGTEVCALVGFADDGTEFRCDVTASDPRVSGERTVMLHEWDQATGEMTGTVTITNDGGSWTGPSTGYDDPSGAYEPGEQYVEGVLVGGGDYAGLQFDERIEFGPSEGSPSTITGTIESTP